MSKLFTGTGVAIVTPFKAYAIDFEALEQLIEHLIKGGVEFIVALGTTGETPTLSEEERHAVLDFVVEKVAKRVKVVAGFGGNNTAVVLEQIKAYHFKGIDGILSASPGYNKPSQEGIFQHFMAIDAIAPCPIILYNVPGRTGSNMLPSTILRLAKASTRFVAIKEASGNIEQCMQLVHENTLPHFSVLSGDDNLTLPMLSFGVEGVISVVANAYPRGYSDMVRSGLAGDFKTASQLHFKYMDFVNLLFADGNPSGIKAALSCLGICKETFRLPVVPVNSEVKKSIESAVQQLS